MSDLAQDICAGLTMLVFLAVAAFWIGVLV